MRQTGLAHLGGEAEGPPVGHQVVAGDLPRLGIDRQRQPRLRVHLEPGGQDVLEIGHRPWAAEHRDHGRGRVQAPARAGVAARRIANHLDVEVRLDRPAIQVARRPRAGDTEQPLVQQQRVRGRLDLRQVRAVRPIERRKQRILAAGLCPSPPGRGRREAHAVGRLMAGHAGPAVGSQGLEEGMAPRVHRAAIEQQTQIPRGVVIIELGREDAALARLPPGRRQISRSQRGAEEGQPDQPQGRDRGRELPRASPRRHRASPLDRRPTSSPASETVASTKPNQNHPPPRQEARRSTSLLSCGAWTRGPRCRVIDADRNIQDS